MSDHSGQTNKKLRRPRRDVLDLEKIGLKWEEMTQRREDMKIN